MRTRNRTTATAREGGTENYQVYNLPSGPLIQNSTQTYLAGTLSSGYKRGEVSVITDEQPRQKRPGNCVHTTSKTELYKCTPVQTYVQSGQRHTRVFTGDAFHAKHFGSGDGWLTIPVTVNTVNWDQLSYESMKEMRPKFSDASFANDILELREMKSLLKTFKPRDSKSWKDSLKRRADSELQFQYGVAPVIGFFLEIQRLLNSIPASIARMRSRIGKIETRHYSRRLDLLSGIPADGYLYVEGSYIKIRREVRLVKAPIYHANLRYTYDIQSLSDFALSVRAWSEAFGLNRPASILWNAIPFSFIVDWIVNVNEWLDSWLGEPLIPIKVVDYNHSVTYSYRSTLLCDFQYVGEFPVAARTSRYYERRVQDPVLTSRLELNMPSVDNVLSGALLLTSYLLSDNTRKSRKPPRSPWLNFGKVREHKPR